MTEATVNVGGGVSLRHNLSDFLKGFAGDAKAFGFAQTVALTRTARATATEFMPAEARRVFDRPTPYTLGGFWWRPATADKTAFEVGIKDFAGKGTPAAKFLAAQVFGGTRGQKRSERLLQPLSGNFGYWVPAPGMILDAYGNVPGATMTRILSDLQVQGDAAQNRTSRSMARNKKRYANERFFVPPVGSGLHPGVWVKRGNRTVPVLFFVATPHYQQRFDFFGKGMAFASDRFPIELSKAVEQGYATPK